jgi:hypothetical protein
MARALGVNIVSTFDSKGIRKAINDFKKLEGAGWNESNICFTHNG